MELDIRSRCQIHTNTDGNRFVGVKADTNGIIVYFPIGYNLPDEDSELRKDIQNLLKVLSLFAKKEESIQGDKHETPHSVDFPLNAYFKLIRYYLEHGYYIEKEKIHKTDMKGKVDWKRTIRKQKPLVTISGKPVYTKLTVNFEEQNANKLITAINKYCVYESFDKFGWLFLPIKPVRYSMPCSYKQAQQILNDSLKNTNVDSKKLLFKAMIDILKYQDLHSEDKTFNYGTNHFETVWERLIDCAFGIENKTDYQPHAEWQLGDGDPITASALRPDTIMFCGDDCYVLDAKYYRYGVTNNKEHLPSTADINKQITLLASVKNNLSRDGLKQPIRDGLKQPESDG